MTPLLLLCLLNQNPITDFHKQNPDGDKRDLSAPTVIADKGTNVRAQANTRSTIIGQLKFGDAVTILERTKQKLTLKENNVTLTGSWVKIEAQVLERDPKTKKVLRNRHGDFKRSKKIGYIFNAFLAPADFRPPDPRHLCGGHCKKANVSFASEQDFKKALAQKRTAIREDNGRQKQNEDGSITLTLDDKRKVIVKPTKALKQIDGGAAFSAKGFAGNIPMLDWSGHMGDGFVLLNPKSGKIDRIVEGTFHALSNSQKSIAFYTANGESDSSHLNVHFAGESKSIVLDEGLSWCLAGQSVFEDDKTLLVQVMRKGDCHNPEYDSQRSALQVPLRIRLRE